MQRTSRGDEESGGGALPGMMDAGDDTEERAPAKAGAAAGAGGKSGKDAGGKRAKKAKGIGRVTDLEEFDLEAEEPETLEVRPPQTLTTI